MPQSTLLNLPSSDDVAQQFREDIEFGCAANGLAVPPTGPGTHYGLTATGAGNISSILIANQQLLDNDSNPLTAVGAALEQIRISDGLTEKPPVAARLQLKGAVQGTATIPAGLEWQGPGGVRGKIDSAITRTSTSDVPLTSTVSDAGSAGNLAAGTIVNFINAPLNVQQQASVISILSEGADIESDEDKRNRILLARQNPPAGGNWSQVVEIALAAASSADGCWVYPALGGPGATKVILTQTSATFYLDRSVDTVGIDAVITALQNELPKEAQNFVVDTAINQSVTAMYQLSLASSGGVFWSDGASAWPEVPLTLTALTGTTYTATSTAIGDATALATGQTRKIAIWSSGLQQYAQLTVSRTAGTAPGPYTVDIPGAAAGSLDGYTIMPWAPNLSSYAKALVSAMLKMGPGEYLAGTNPRYPRAHRRPEPATSGPYVLNSVQSSQVQAAFEAEILQMDLKPNSSITPTLPANAAGKPSVLVPSVIVFFPGV